MYKIIINDFFELLKFINYQGKENKIEGDKKISNIIYELEDLISKHSIRLFEAGDNFTIDKLYDIFDYFLKVIFKDIINEMKTYQEELDYDSKSEIKNYRNNHLIRRQDLIIAIRLFIELKLFLEDNKENIKLNKNNIFNYLNSSAYWDINLYNNNEFEENLNELKSMDLKINQIIYLYKYLNKNSNEYSFDDVKQIIYGEIRKNSSSSSSSSETEGICCGSPERVTHCFRGCRRRRKKEEDECSSD